MKTSTTKISDITRAWYVLDASEIPLGRLATQAARLLIGKDKPLFAPYVDCGDYVIVINATQLVVTGNKLQAKKYYQHSGYPGGIKEASLGEKLVKDPSEAIRQAVRGMLPVNKLRAGRLARLKVYSGADHGHEAQKPEKLSLKEKK